MNIRVATPEDDNLLIEHHIKIWESYAIETSDFDPDAREKVRLFLEEGRARTGLRSFIATFGGEVAGSCSCYVGFPTFPAVIRSDVRQAGYIWSVFVDQAFRRRGIARALAQAAVDFLQQSGCTMVILHSSEAAVPVYRGLGFMPGPEMRLKFDR